jgi:hypothetical protein
MTKKPAATIPEMVREYQTCFQAGEKFGEHAPADRRADRRMCEMIHRCDRLQDRILATPAATPADLAAKRRFKECLSLDLNEVRLVEIILKLDVAHLALKADITARIGVEAK